MSGRPDHAAARWADDADGGVEEPGAGQVTRPGSSTRHAPSRVAADEGGPVAADEGAGAGAAVGANAEAEGARGAVSEDAAGADAEAGAGAEADADADAEAGADAEGARGAASAPTSAADDTAGDGRVGGGQILVDVAAISAQRDEYLESLQRLKADFDNYRKRVARLQEEQSARAEANLVGKLLPVIDNLDLAWAHLGPRDEDEQGESGAVSEEARAIAQARGQLLDVLGKEGLERVDAVGVPFDPTVHDAVAHAEPDDERAGAPQPQPGGEAGAEGDVTADGSTLRTVSVDGVLRAGYRWRGQVLRPAMVRVRG
jgi:molecular chaperone GrpE